MITEKTETSNVKPKKVLKQLSIDEEMDTTLETLKTQYENDLNLELTVQEVIRKLVKDHPDYQAITLKS